MFHSKEGNSTLQENKPKRGPKKGRTLVTMKEFTSAGSRPLTCLHSSLLRVGDRGEMWGGRIFQRCRPSWLGERTASWRDSVGTLREEHVPTGWERMEVMEPRRHRAVTSTAGVGAVKVWGRTGALRLQEEKEKVSLAWLNSQAST